jgi:hypothetical protein
MPQENITENQPQTDPHNEAQASSSNNSLKGGEDTKDYSLEEDYDALLALNLNKEAAIKLQLHKHPDPQIDALLERRIDLKDPKLTLNPFGIRILSSMIIIFLLGILIWAMIWLFGSILGLSTLAKSLSSLLAVIVISGMSISIFQPLPLIDESLFNNHLINEMNKIRKIIEKDEKSEKSTQAGTQ